MSKVIAVMPAALDKAALIKGIEKVCKDASSIQERMQVLGLQTLMLMKEGNDKGDIGPANRFLSLMPLGMRRNALASWFMAYGPYVVNTDAATKKTTMLKYDKTKSTDLDGALSDPWYMHLPEKPVDEVFDLQKAVHALLKKAEGKTVTFGSAKLSDEATADTLKALRSLVGEKATPTPGELIAAAAE